MGGMANAIGQLDTRIEIVTPENIAFQYRLAGPFRRLPAFLIDVGIRFAVAIGAYIAAALIFGTIGLEGLGVGLTLLLWFLLEWFYGGLFEALWNGQTPGKRLLGIRVVSIDGRPITPLQAILRNILREADALPFVCYPYALPIGFYVVGLLTAMLNDRFQRLGDLAVGTMVIVEQRQQLREVLQIHEPEAVRAVAAIPPTFQPTRALARALAAYAGRRRTFAWGRRMEIARHIGEPLRERFPIPPDADLDLLLCGLYQRAYIADLPEETEQGQSPFLPPQNPFAPPGVVAEMAAEVIAAEEVVPEGTSAEEMLERWK